MLVEASQARISRKRIVMDNEPDPERDYPDEGHWGPERGDSGPHSLGREHEDDLEALREMETRGRGTDREEEEDLDVMEAFATQTQVVPQTRPRDTGAQETEGDEDDEEMREVGEDEAVQSAAVIPPPVFRPLHFDIEENLTRSVEKRMRKGHEPVLEEQPKWSLLAKVLKEIEDTIARVSESHAGESARRGAGDQSKPRERRRRGRWGWSRFEYSLMIPLRCSWDKHRIDHGVVRPVMPPTPTVPDHHDRHRPTIWRWCRSEDDGNPFPLQLAAREERRAAGQPGADGAVSGRGRGSGAERGDGGEEDG
jgi:hypothetical protein